MSGISRPVCSLCSPAGAVRIPTACLLLVFPLLCQDPHGLFPPPPPCWEKCSLLPPPFSARCWAVHASRWPGPPGLPSQAGASFSHNRCHLEVERKC